MILCFLLSIVEYNTYKRGQKDVSGIDTTSCQPERNFSALKLVVSDLWSRMSPVRVEHTVFLRLNKHLIPGLNKVLVSLQLFPSIYIDVGATNGVFLLFPNGFLLCDHGLDC